VGIGVVAPPSKVIYGGLRNRWVDFLSQQDKSFRPHYTIQNKAEPVEAQKAFEKVKKAFPGSRGWVDGSTLWRYDKGYWRHVRDSRFSEADGDGSLATGEGVSD